MNKAADNPFWSQQMSSRHRLFFHPFNQKEFSSSCFTFYVNAQILKLILYQYLFGPQFILSGLSYIVIFMYVLYVYKSLSWIL